MSDDLISPRFSAVPPTGRDEAHSRVYKHKENDSTNQSPPRVALHVLEYYLCLRRPMGYIYGPI